MASRIETFPRGSEWRQWDLHIHSPASYEWKGEKFSTECDQPRDLQIVDQMIGALNEATPAVFGLMDYWCFDGWFALKKRLATPEAPKLKKTVFPGIELRLVAPMDGRLNAHVLFSDKIADQHLRDFLSNLRLALSGRPLSRDALIDYTRHHVGADKLKTHGFNKLDIENDDSIAFIAGCQIAEITEVSYRSAIAEVPGSMAVGFMPFSTNDGLKSVNWAKHYAYVLGLFNSSPIFETRDDPTGHAFAGVKTDPNRKWFDAFQDALGKVPRLPVSGSDAHRFKGVPGNNELRGYGDYPSDRITWIKADPTWHGLLHAIKEPAKRCYIGSRPPKLRQIAENGSYYVDTISLIKKQNGNLSDIWFDGTELPLNPDLVAIIGNKGSGKSALADVLALLGNSREYKYFSFLKAERFRGKTGEPARYFQGKLSWRVGDPCIADLADNPTGDRVELIRYIPQGRFEALCNDHVSGRSSEFERELRSVIFSHIPEKDRLGALNFDELSEIQERGFHRRLAEMRKNLGLLNRTIARFEELLNPIIRQNIEEQIKLREVQIKSLEDAKPAEVAQPPGELIGEQQDAAKRLAQIAEDETKLTVDEATIRERQGLNAAKSNAVREARERIKLFEEQLATFRSELEAPLATLDTSVDDVLRVIIMTDKFDKIISDIQADRSEIETEFHINKVRRGVLVEDKKRATVELNEPQRRYQAYLTAVAEWQQGLDAIIGSDSAPDSKKGLEKRLEQLAALPSQLKALRAERDALTSSIFDVLSEQRDARSALFTPIQDLISNNDLIREAYRLQFRANLAASHDAVSDNLFAIVKQAAGDIRGDDESRHQIKRRMDEQNLDQKEGVLAFINSVHGLLHTAARQASKQGFDLGGLMRKDRSPVEIYDYLFGLEYLQSKYTLLFQDTQIEQLSPGQRGALLLVFYLLVDQGRNPIILDQPEENLDNETIVSLLVPVINAAKERRQIIMVTHNPNLAVVCDAEQIIHAKFDRKPGPAITYQSGSIEDGKLNACVVDVLEGTKPAFDNRRQKYH